MTNKQRMRELRKKRKINNLCTRCGAVKDIKGTRCNKCVKYNKARRKKEREKKEKTGIDKRIRKLKKWKVKNFSLFYYLYSNRKTIKEFAEEINVSARQVQRWIFEKGRPNQQNEIKVRNLIGKDVFN